MDLVFEIVGGLMLLVAFAGCVIPVIPGPALGYGGLLCLTMTEKCPPVPLLVGLAVLVVVVTIADYVVPAWGAKKFDCTRWGTTGCFIGTIAGVFFMPLGLVLGPFLGAFLGELVAGKPIHLAVRGGFGALLGFLSGLLFKFLTCIVLVVAYAWCL